MKQFFAIITVFLSLTAQVAFAQEGNFFNDGTDYEGRIVVITDAREPPSATFCGREFLVYKAVVIIQGGGRTIITTLGITPGVVVNTGDRFDIQTPTVCAGRISVSLVRK